MKPLITNNFRATTIPKTFFINALVISIISTIAVESRALMTRHNTKSDLTEVQKGAITWSSTFIAGLLTYTIMYILFNYGGGMMAPKKLI